MQAKAHRALHHHLKRKLQSVCKMTVRALPRKYVRLSLKHDADQGKKGISIKKESELETNAQKAFIGSEIT
jgi:hypothetical protein